jgi:ABC-type branched-subunit amino acid transport system ATPase component
MNDPTTSAITNLRLSFRLPHRSLQALPDVELPALTVLTGVNGVGKTHLLQAIKAGAVAVEGMSTGEIIYFDWTSMYKLSSNRVERNDVRVSRYTLREAVVKVRENEEATLRQLLETNGVDLEGANPWDLLRNLPDLHGRKDVAGFLASMHQCVGNCLSPAEWERLGIHNSILEHLYGKNMLVLLDDREIELIPSSHPIGNHGFGADNIGKTMLAYFEIYTHNRLCALDKAAGRTPEMPVLSDSDFVQLYGPPPWEVLTSVMQDLGLDFEVRGPSSYSAVEYVPRAIKRSTGAAVELEHLSSGEKMLMALALSTYATTTRTMREAAKIKLVLLDEIDAPLHPSMSRVMMGIIRTTIQQRLGCAVILATHAPATVVVAPEGSVYVMRPGRAGIHAQGRERALRMLTSELPTLSLDFSGRRQVFVESHHDAERYERLYRLYESHLNSELSLSFIGVGVESTAGSFGAGCQVVRKLVNQLREHGNRTVWGLVDWDRQAESTTYIRVLAKDRRYAIENCLLDPLLVAALVIDTNDDRQIARLELAPDYRIVTLASLDAQQDRQRSIDAVQRHVHGRDANDSEQVKVAYFGGFAHHVSNDYLQCRGHELAAQVFDAFPCLKRYKNEHGLLERSLWILKEHPGLLPRELFEALQQLLEPEV